jgi:hypothetical protein
MGFSSGLLFSTNENTPIGTIMGYSAIVGVGSESDLRVQMLKTTKGLTSKGTSPSQSVSSYRTSFSLLSMIFDWSQN